MRYRHAATAQPICQGVPWLFAQDGSDPRAILDTMRRQISEYPNVHFFDAAAVDARKDNGDIKVVLANGSIVAGSRLHLALGVSDILPDISGLSVRWGKSVLHCPYCHGYEVSGQRLGVLNVSTMSLQQALLVSDWGRPPSTRMAAIWMGPALNSCSDAMAKSNGNRWQG
ncbi:hypothetical protein [Devosia sp.]|uniref:hypothetical protein n=1 Tax=Devosia sp. TaxID=1871048 RepID=UPI0019F912F2|nr:hypothetical protein [Devosia sp.]MBE0580835.1 NAD(P)/FAD-dependent oxidoreductase [Devosia sp.]